MAPMNKQMQITVTNIHDVPGKVKALNSPALAKASV
jgi:hypothetical protein